MSKKITEIAMTLPFTISSYGKVSQTTDQSKIWIDRVRSVVGTLVGERVMRPRFGSTIPTNIFNTQTDAADKLESEIDTAFTQYLPLLSLTSVSVSIDDYENIISAEVVYSLPNDESITTNIGFSTISSTSTILEENL